MTGRFVLTLALAAGALWSCSAVQNKRAPRHITYWEKWTGFEGAAMDAVVDDFNAKEVARAKADPSYAPIEVEKVTISNVEQKLLIAIAGGNPPDLAGNYSFYVAAYADGGALTDLGPMLQKSGFDRGAYIEHYMRLGEYRGKTWALPIVPASIALLTNKRLFTEAGLDPDKPPITIEELDDFAAKLTKWEVTLANGEKKIETGYLPDVPASQKRLLQAGFLPSEPGWWAYGWGYFFGGSLLSGTDKITAADPANQRAYDWVASYSNKLGIGVIKRFRSGFGNFASPQNGFLSGKVAMVLQGVWMHNFIEKYSPGLQWAAAPFPYPAGHPELAFTTSADADVLVIPKDSPHPLEAFEFMKYLSTQRVLEKLCLGQQKFTPLKAVSDDFWRNHPNPYIRLFRELGMSKNTFSIPQTGIWNEYNRELTNAVDLIQNLTEPPAVALAEVQTKMQAALDRNHRILAPERLEVRSLASINRRNGLLFCLPWLIGLAVFLLYPLAAAFYYSLCDYSVLLPPVYIGLDNYTDLLKDALFWKSLWNTTYYAIGSVGLGLLVSLTLALLLNSKVRGIGVYRTVFFLPSLMPVVAGSILWLWMYNGQSGIINTGLHSVGINGPAWLADPAWAKAAIVLMAVWGAGNAMVIYLAGLQDVPTHLYEAAIIDGAGFWQRLIHVTLPMISPVIYFNVVLSIIGGFQAFTQAFIMTGSTGAPERSTLFYVLNLYNVGFQDLRMGYASAMAWVLFVVILIVTFAATKLSRRFVTYDR